MHVLVTGAAGFIGSRLSRRLLERGDRVLGLDNFNPYYDPARKERNVADLLPYDAFALIRGDFRDVEAMRDLFAVSGFEAVAHMGAMAGVRYSVDHPLLYEDVNSRGTLSLLEAGRQTNQPYFVLASTSSVYGDDTPVPFTEDAAADKPLAPYPASKRSMELMAHAYHNMAGTGATIVRFFSVYGPHGRPDMMPWHWTASILQGRPLKLYGEGKLRRDWTYIDDIVSGIVAALDARLPWETINLGNGRPIENLRFVRRLEELLDREAVLENVPTPASEPFETYADISRARQLLSYDPTTTVEEGLARFVAWYRAEGLG
jgi:UDP-glucuronate 4-epimerase